jgi:hypothetical protein
MHILSFLFPDFSAGPCCWSHSMRTRGFVVKICLFHLDSCRRTMSYVRRTTSYITYVAHDVVRKTRTNVRHVQHSTRTMSYVVHVRHRISMSYVRHVRHRNIRCRSTYDIASIRCRTCIRYRRSDVRHRMSHRIRHRMFDLHIVRSSRCIQHRIRHSIRHCMQCSFNWIRSWVQGVQLACTITQAQEFAWQCLHSGIDRPTRGRRSRAIAAALGSGGRGSSSRGSSISGGRGSRFLFPILIPIRHAKACGVNCFAFGNVHNIPFFTSLSADSIEGGLGR